MKKLLFYVAVGFSGLVQAQNITSVTNGNWAMPSTWDCTCIPGATANITVAHNVTLNSSWQQTAGSITINSGASLIQTATPRDLWITGTAALNIDGALDVRYLWTEMGTLSVSVNGDVTVRSFLNNISFTNTGVFHDIDSMYTTSNIINNGSFVGVDSVTLEAVITNNGTFTCNQCTNIGTLNNAGYFVATDITNTGTITNSLGFWLQNSGWNLGNIYNSATGTFTVVNDFLNQDPVNNDALLDNDGYMDFQDSWYNFNDVKGAGTYEIQDSSVNSGAMTENFVFCDHSAPASATTIVDYNTGSIAGTITFCATMQVPEQTQDEMFAVTDSDGIHVFNRAGFEDTSIELFDLSGKAVAFEMYGNGNTLLLKPGCVEGIYLLKASHNQITRVFKLYINQ